VDKLTTAHTFINDLKWSLRCAAVAALPLAIAMWLLFALFGGIEGDGKLVWIAALWPMIALDPFTKGSDGPLVWAVFLVAELSYVYSLVLGARTIWRLFWAKRRW
jgi:hypothetical protein